VRQLNAAGWQAMKANKQTSLKLSIDQAFFPANLGSIGADTTNPIAVYPWPPAQPVGAPPFMLVLPSDKAPGLEGNNASDSTGWEFKPRPPGTLIGTWTLQFPPDAKTAFETIDDLLIIVPFQGALNWDS
jgi:hypothetical protein